MIIVSLAFIPLIQNSPRSVGASNPTFTAMIVDNAYQPTQINIATGTQVVWTYSSTGNAQHTVTSTANTNTTQGGMPLISSGPMNPGQSFSYTFYKHGSYPIQCAFHSFMNALVNVTGSDIQPPPPAMNTSTDYTPYAIGGAIVGALVIVSIALFLRRQTQKGKSASPLGPP